MPSSEANISYTRTKETSTAVFTKVSAQRGSQAMLTDPKYSSAGRYRAMDYESTLRDLHGLNLDNDGRPGY